jgi:phosphoribosyl 1,2-cyclic phosphate phosphodiesterase
MQTSLKFTLLGSGSSGGVPRVGNQWGKCDPSNSKNRRRRCAALIETTSESGTTSVLIDAGADLREQLLSANVKHLDGVLLTHSHADHIFGLDDLRQLALVMKTPIPVHMDAKTAEIVMPAFGYIFKQAPTSSYPAFCTHREIHHEESICIDGAAGSMDFLPLVAEHGDIHALGFKIGNLAYLPDMKRISNTQSLNALKNLDVLIVDCLREIEHPAHLSLNESLAFIEEVNPTRAILTNLHSDLDYETLRKKLPAHIVPGFDGLEIATHP